MWIIIIAAIVIYIIYKVISFGNSEVEQKVTDQGGMQIKYKTLIDYFNASPSSKITKLTKDNVIISSPTITFNIAFIGGQTEILIYAILPLIGEISNRWRYLSNFPQEKIIEEIENFIDGKMKEYQKLANSNFEQYIKH